MMRNIILLFLLLIVACTTRFEHKENVTLVIREPGYDLWNPNLVQSDRLCYQRTTFLEGVDTTIADTVNEIWITDLDGSNKRLVKSDGFNILMAASRTGEFLIADSAQEVILVIDTTGAGRIRGQPSKLEIIY